MGRCPCRALPTCATRKRKQLLDMTAQYDPSFKSASYSARVTAQDGTPIRQNVQQVLNSQPNLSGSQTLASNRQPAPPAQSAKFQWWMPDGPAYQIVPPDKSPQTGGFSDAQVQNVLSPPPAMQIGGLPRLQAAPSDWILPIPAGSDNAGGGILGQTVGDTLTGGILGSGPAPSFGGLLGDANAQNGNGNYANNPGGGLIGGGMFAANQPADQWTQVSAKIGQNGGANGGNSDGGMFVNGATIQKDLSTPDTGDHFFEQKPTPYQQAAKDQLTALGLGNGIERGNQAIDPRHAGTPDPNNIPADNGPASSGSNDSTALAKSLDDYLLSKKSPLAGMGDRLVYWGQQYNVDPRLLVALAGAETGFGANVTWGKNNLWNWGWNSSNRSNSPFNSLDSGIHSVAKGLDAHYDLSSPAFYDGTVKGQGANKAYYCTSGCTGTKALSTILNDLGGDPNKLGYGGVARPKRSQ